MYDLLTDPLITTQTESGIEHLNLPGVLAALSDGRLTGYPRLRAHQADPWHVFLVQLAASIQARFPTDPSPTNPLPCDAKYWHDGLLNLAQNEASAWHLVEDDVTKPAFLQHPWTSREDETADDGVTTKDEKIPFKPKARTPDELDVLLTSRNHDVKISRIRADDTEAWVFALVLLQTTSGVLGLHNYGIVRMNAGYGSRSIVSWAHSTHPARRFQEEVVTLKAWRDSVLKKHGYKDDGTVLTWITPWERTKHQHLLVDLDPWFIEAARPVRLRMLESGSIEALGTTSKARQIGPKTIDNGDVGDPWTPVNILNNKKGRSALTLLEDGFTPKLLTDLLFERDYELTFLQQPREGEEPGWFLASCLVRGQGTTNGFHQVALPVPPKARLAFLTTESRKTLGHLAQYLLNDAKNVEEALEAAVVVLVEGGSEKADFDRDAVKAWIGHKKNKKNKKNNENKNGVLAAYAREWNSHFFPTLWRGAEEPHEDVRASWQQTLVEVAAVLLEDARQRLPLPANRTWRAITQAHSAMQGMLKRQKLPLLGQRNHSGINQEEAIA